MKLAVSLAGCLLLVLAGCATPPKVGPLDVDPNVPFVPTGAESVPVKPTATPSSTASASPSVSASPTPTPTATATASASASASPTPTPSASASADTD